MNDMRKLMESVKDLYNADFDPYEGGLRLAQSGNYENAFGAYKGWCSWRPGVASEEAAREFVRGWKDGEGYFVETANHKKISDPKTSKYGWDNDPAIDAHKESEYNFMNMKASEGTKTHKKWTKKWIDSHNEWKAHVAKNAQMRGNQ